MRVRGIVGTVDAEVGGVKMHLMIPELGHEEDLADDLLVEAFRAILLDGVERSPNDIIGEIGSSDLFSEKAFQGFVFEPGGKQVESTLSETKTVQDERKDDITMGQGVMPKFRQSCVDQIDDAKSFNKCSNDPKMIQTFGEGFRGNLL
jgi:hypothetical protein